MAEVVGNPDEIESFARELGAYCESTLENLGKLASHLNRMEADRSWADDIYRHYRGMFESASHSVQQTIDFVRDEHLQHLHSVAQRLREYLNE
jgi:hypothetical protein